MNRSPPSGTWLHACSHAAHRECLTVLEDIPEDCTIVNAHSSLVFKSVPGYSLAYAARAVDHFHSAHIYAAELVALRANSSGATDRSVRPITHQRTSCELTRAKPVTARSARVSGRSMACCFMAAKLRLL